MKHKLKHSVFLLLITVLLSALLLPAMAENTQQTPMFADVPPERWYYGEVCALAARGVVNGYPDGTFRPEAAVTYAEAIKMILGAAGYAVENSVEGEWYQPYLRFAYASGIADEDTSPAPDQPITRYRSAELIVRAMGLPLQVEAAHPFVDTENIYAVTLWDAGLMRGEMSGGLFYFRGGRELSRAELAALVWRMMEKRAAEQTAAVTVNPLLPATCTLPEAPKTVEDFIQMLIYLAVNGVEEHTFIYRGVSVETVKEEYLPRLREAYPFAADLCRESVIYYHSYNINLSYARNYVAMTIALRGRDYTAAECKEMVTYSITAAEEALREVRASLTAEGVDAPTQRQLARACITWLAANCRYLDSERMLDQYAYSVFADGSSVCSGYTAAYNLMLKLCGIRCMSMTGDADNGREISRHAWTIAELDGEICYIDSTWCDPVIEPDDPASVSYLYFAMDAAEFARTHVPEWDYTVYWEMLR